VGAVAPALFPGVSNQRLVRGGLLCFAAALAVFALLRQPAPAFPIAIAVGATYLTMATALTAAFQAQLRDDERGRLTALWTVAFAGIVALSNLLFGPLIDALGITPLLLGGTAMAVLLAWYARIVPEPAREAPARALADPDPGYSADDIRGLRQADSIL